MIIPISDDESLKGFCSHYDNHNEEVRDYMFEQRKQYQSEEWDLLMQQLDSQPQPFLDDEEMIKSECNLQHNRSCFSVGSDVPFNEEQNIIDTTFDHHQYIAPIDETIIQPQINKQPPSVSCCQCVKINCLKSYCSCYAKGQSCGESCTCQNCKNKLTIKSTVPQGQRGCKCQKNYCIKRYCECRNKNQVCSTTCSCTNCKNQTSKVSVAVRRQSESSELNQTVCKVLRIRKKIRKQRY